LDELAGLLLCLGRLIMSSTALTSLLVSELEFVTPLERQETATTDWRRALPVLTGEMVTLRELRKSDAPSLLAMIATEEVARFISPPPTTVEGFERFIEWTHRQRAAGTYACFAVVLGGTDTAIGIFQVRQLEPSFGTAEWGFAIGSAFWGRGVFMDAAKLTLGFVFDTLGVHRLEARAAIKHGRGTGALAKVGAIKEGLLRKSFYKDGEYLDQSLWSILREDWQAKAVWGAKAARIH
jgi:RimJ/RimL family protein N-acetyltransferase